MGGPGFYGPMGAVDAGPHGTGSLSTTDPMSELVAGDEEQVKKEAKEGENDKKEKQTPTREAFMDPTFGGFYDDLAAGPPADNLPLGDRPYEKGTFKKIDIVWDTDSYLNPYYKAEV